MCQMEWIPITNGMPNFNEHQETEIVLMTDGFNTWAGYFFRNGQGKTEYDSFPPDEYGVTGRPTHWAQIGELPQPKWRENGTENS